MHACCHHVTPKLCQHVRVQGWRACQTSELQWHLGIAMTPPHLNNLVKWKTYAAEGIFRRWYFPISFTYIQCRRGYINLIWAPLTQINVVTALQFRNIVLSFTATHAASTSMLFLFIFLLARSLGCVWKVSVFFPYWHKLYLFCH